MPAVQSCPDRFNTSAVAASALYHYLRRYLKILRISCLQIYWSRTLESVAVFQEWLQQPVLIAESDTGMLRLIDVHLTERDVANTLSQLKRKILVFFNEKHALNPTQDKSSVVTGEISVT